MTHTVSPLNDIKERSERLFSRLSEKEYHRDYVFTPEAATEWPGDWVGRAILAQTLQSGALEKQAQNLEGLLEELSLQVNELGYLGPVYEGIACEQQLSGHSWLLRGLCAYSSYSGDSRYLEMAVTVVRNLWLPIKELYKEYPIDPSLRKEAGDMSGTTQGRLGNWLVSSDTGCAFIGIDGVSDVYMATGETEIAELLEVMIDRFLQIDLLKIKAQTHASLTAARGILRFYMASGKKAYLDVAENIFDLYTGHGMTVNFENQNWFDRPEWTEPCAVIDSFILASQLYGVTGKTEYADLAQKILYNGIYHEQRSSGGFGCNTCAVDGIIRTHCYEASWCCTMRGGEGLAGVLKYAYFDNKETLTVIYPISSEMTFTHDGHEVKLIQKTDYPYDDEVSFEAVGLQGQPLTICIYDTETKDFIPVSLSSVKPTAVVSLSRSVTVKEANGRKAVFYGPLLMAQDFSEKNEPEKPDLSCIQKVGRSKLVAGKVTLEPLGNLYTLTRQEEGKAARKVLF